MLTTLIVSMHLSVSAQDQKSSHTQYPKIGEACPEFTINQMYNHPKKSISEKDFKGHWTVLYFWSRWCTSSMKNFAKLQTLQNKLKNHSLNQIPLRSFL